MRYFTCSLFLIVLLAVSTSCTYAMEKNDDVGCLAKIFCCLPWKLTKWCWCNGWYCCCHSSMDKELYAEAANAPDGGCVWWLIKSGVSVNAHDNGWSALAGAITYNPDPSMVEELCSQKADVNHACPCNGINSWPQWDPLRLAAKHGRVEHAKILLKYGASVAPAEYNAAHIPIAIDHGHAAVAALLMRQGAYVSPFLLYIDKEKEVFDEARHIYYTEDVRLITQELNASDSPTFRITPPVNAITAAYAAEYPLMETHPLGI